MGAHLGFSPARHWQKTVLLKGAGRPQWLWLMICCKYLILASRHVDIRDARPWIMDLPQGRWARARSVGATKWNPGDSGEIFPFFVFYFFKERESRVQLGSTSWALGPSDRPTTAVAKLWDKCQGKRRLGRLKCPARFIFGFQWYEKIWKDTDKRTYTHEDTRTHIAHSLPLPMDINNPPTCSSCWTSNEAWWCGEPKVTFPLCSMSSPS